MGMRPLRLPHDFAALADMLVETFQYPENPEWSVQADEKEDLAQEIRGMRRVWPLVRLLQLVHPPLRDILRGFIWEEDGRPVAAVIVQRMGSSSTWSVGVVGVLPAYRRRGLARRLLEHTLEFLRARDAERVVLAVIDGNVPAYALYQSLGFTHYGGQGDYYRAAAIPEAVPPLPAGYAEERLPRSDWRTRFELERRIVPETHQRYEPVVAERFRRPLPVRMLAPAVLLLTRKRRVDRALRTETTRKVIGRYGFVLSRKSKGVGRIMVALDPAHAVLAPYIIGTALREVASANPGLRVELFAPRWMDGLAEAAEALGFKRRLEYHELGLVF